MSAHESIAKYRDAKVAMAAMISRHMGEAFAEIQEKFGITPTSVELEIHPHQAICERFPSGIYAGCVVRLAGDQLP